VELSEDPISTFFNEEDCPKVVNIPKGIDEETGEVIRETCSVAVVHCRYGDVDVPLKAILDDFFFEHGRIRPHERVLCRFPKYFQLYADTYATVIGKSLDDTDVWRLDQKLYLAIMAVSCYHCDYLLNILEEQFVLEGGELTWLTEGLEKVDPRLRRFSELNEILAFRPWALSSNHLQPILQTDEAGLACSAEQLVKGALVLAHYHGLCSFVLSQGLTEDSKRVLEQINLTKKGSCEGNGLPNPPVKKSSGVDQGMQTALEQYNSDYDDDVERESADEATGYYTEDDDFVQTASSKLRAEAGAGTEEAQEEM